MTRSKNWIAAFPWILQRKHYSRNFSLKLQSRPLIGDSGDDDYL
jgi:hypothetical protein